jgi:hypothetical protein
MPGHKVAKEGNRLMSVIRTAVQKNKGIGDSADSGAMLFSQTRNFRWLYRFFINQQADWHFLVTDRKTAEIVPLCAKNFV